MSRDWQKVWVLAWLRHYRDEARRLKDMERVATLYPEEAASWFMRMAQANQAEGWRELWYHYGLEVPRLWEPSKPRVVYPERVSRILTDERRFYATLIEYVRWESCMRWMVHEGIKAEQSGDDLSIAVCKGFLEAHYLAHDVAALVGAQINRDRVREALAVRLAGLVAAGTSLSRNKRLKNMLSADGDSPFERLLEELPGAVFLEWGNMRPDAPIGEFANRVLTRVGKDVVLERRDKLADESPDLLVDDTPNSLEEFAAREDLRETMEAAHLAERERQVMELVLLQRTGAEIADALGISEGSVKTLRFRAKKKLRRAAGL